jgi:alpha-L-arabinofuranosidase
MVGHPLIPLDHIDSGPLLKPYVVDALDEIEYGIGETYWRTKRAANGHPAPFKLQYRGWQRRLMGK